MAIEYEIIEEKHLVIAKGTGVVTGDDVINHLNTLAADARYVAPMKKLVDYRAIESMKQSHGQILMISQKKQTLEDRFAGERCALVAPKDLTFGIARMHQSFINTPALDIEVFRRIEDALAWLDVELGLEAKQENP